MAYLKEGSPLPTSGRGKNMSPKMEKFVQEYLKDMDAPGAILRAGYKTGKRNKHNMVTQLMRHPRVKAAIEEGMESRKERMSLTADYVLTKLTAIVESTQDNNPSAALRGLELLGKHLGLYVDRQEVSGPDGKAIEMERKVKEDVSDFTKQLKKLTPLEDEKVVILASKK